MNVLLERDPALAALESALNRVRAGRGGVAIVAGEAGIGKSSLVERFAASLDRAVDVATGACDALFTPRPLGPLRDVALHWGDDALLDDATERHALFSLVLQRLRDRRGPLVLVFEDVHWADEATLDLVKFVGRRIAALPLLLVLTYRDDEVGAGHPLRAVLGDLPASVSTRVTLERLSEHAVAQLARASGYRESDRGLHALTDGNPFYLTELLASGTSTPSPSLRDAVLARAERLAPPARNALDLAALSPGAIETGLLEACAEDAERSIDECVSRGMLRSVEHGFAFRHELARLVVRDELSPQRRRSLGRKLLEALRTRATGVEALARLAHLAEEAGDSEKVFTYASEAGRNATRVGAHREAREHFKRALAHAQSRPEQERALLLEAFAFECHAAGDMGGAIDARSQAAALWRMLDDVEKVSQTLARQVFSLVGAGRDSEAETASRESISVLEGRPPTRELAFAYRTQAALRMLQRDNVEAIAWARKALNVNEAFGDIETCAASLNTIGSALILSGDEPSGRVHLEEALSLARSIDSDLHVVNALANLGTALGEVYRFDLADAYLAENIAFCSDRDIDHMRLYSLSWQAISHLHQGRWNDASDAATRVIHSPAAAIARMMALLALGRLRARRGDPAIWEALDEALELASGSGTLQRIGPVRAARAEAAWLEGDAQRAALEARAAYSQALAKDHRWFVGELAYWQWKAGALDEIPAIAAEPYSLQMQRSAGAAERAWLARSCPYEAARALADSDDETLLKRALLQFDRLGAMPAAERTRLRLRELGAASIPRGPRATTRANAFRLTARELEIVALIAQGLTNGAIAARLHRSEKTVDHHVSAVLAKLDVTSRDAAATAAASHGLIPK